MYIRRISTTWLACLTLALGACGPSGGNGDGGPALDDDDGDGIANVHEGKADDIDTDGDGTPDFEDLDSDGDGIPDQEEAGDADVNTEPVDSDGDDIPDFRDLDSDDNGRTDDLDGTADIDGDGIGNFADLDDDGDAIPDLSEIGDPNDPTDTDGDGTFDFQDEDSDNDTIRDLHEGTADPDMDLLPAYRDTTSDADCIADRDEAGDADLNTPPIDSDGDNTPNFLDLDSDNDGLSDEAEDANCNGVLDAGETSPIDEDTDNDGAPDPVEESAGTDPTNPADNPQANGDFVFVVPFEENPEPSSDDLDFATNIQILDVYILIDRSGSMTTEISTVRANLQTVLQNITCPPLGNGDPATCIPDVWSGSGTVGYIGSGGQAYSNHVDLQPNPSVPGPAIPTNEPGGCCQEPLLLATHSVATGLGSANSGCSISASYGNRASCAASPAGVNGLGGTGFPCFRDNSIKAILLTTDEAPQNTHNCPAINTVVSAANSINAKVMGIMGDSFEAAALQADLNTLATGTGAVDANNGNAPLVFSGVNANAAQAIENGLRTLTNSVPLDMAAIARDDPNDPNDPGNMVNTVVAFVDRLETLQLGTPECEQGLNAQDTNGDGFPDEYIDVIPGTGVCWRLTAKMNTTVPARATPQLFRSTVSVEGDGSPLDQREVFWFIPAVIDNGPIGFIP